MSTNEKTTTANNQELEDKHWADLERVFSKSNETKMLEEYERKTQARIEARRRRKIYKKRKIASILSWTNTFISAFAVCLLVFALINKLVAVEDSRFYGWCFLAYIVIVAIFVSVGEYIELRIWDKDFE